MEDTHRAVVEVLSGNGRYACNGSCHDMQELLARLHEQAYAIVMVDIDPNPQQMLANLGQVVSMFGESNFVVLSTEMRSEWVLAAMRAGVRNYVLKSAIGADLPDVLDQLPRLDVRESSGKGVIITVLSAAGGCGATTLAVNLADELQRACGEPALLIDLDTFHGGVGAYLGLDGQYSLADVLAHNGHIDSALVLSTAVKHAGGLNVLLSPASTNFSSPRPLNFDNMASVLEACKHAAAFTVIDAPRTRMDLAAMLCVRSVMTLITLQLSVKDVCVARAILSALTARDVRWDSLKPVVNRYCRKRWMVGLDDAQKALGAAPLTLMRNDFSGASASVNFGKPLSQAARRSKLREDVAHLAGRVIAARAEIAAEATKR
jgi:pilus assembly protein CpaE